MLRTVLRTLRIGKEKFYVGADLDGNSYYERPPPEAIDVGNWRLNKRSIEYRGKQKHLSDYGFETLPGQSFIDFIFANSSISGRTRCCSKQTLTLCTTTVQWSAWLRRTRLQPPTLEELQIDVQRQLSIQSNVERLAIAYKEEKLRAIEPPIAESLAAALRNPAFVAREQEELAQQEAVMRKEEERRLAEESGVAAAPVVEKVETESKRDHVEPVEDSKPIPLGEDRARTQAILRRQLGELSSALVTGSFADSRHSNCQRKPNQLRNRQEIPTRIISPTRQPSNLVGDSFPSSNSQCRKSATISSFSIIFTRSGLTIR